MDGSIAVGLTPSIKPEVHPGIAARRARDLKDIRLLKTRVPDEAQLSDELIDWGAGYRNRAHELEDALLNPEFAFTSRERADLQADADSYRALELACRAELTALRSWADPARRLTWAQLAAEAARREAIRVETFRPAISRPLPLSGLFRFRLS